MYVPSGLVQINTTPKHNKNRPANFAVALMSEPLGSDQCVQEVDKDAQRQQTAGKITQIHH